MVKFYRWCIVVGLVLVINETRAGNSDRIGEAGAFELLINTQARTMGLMGINSSNVRGIDALGTNIAGLAHNKGLSVFSNYTSWLSATGTSLFNVGVGGEISNGNNIGFSIGYMTFGAIPRTTSINPEPISTFSPFYLNIGLSYARVFGKGVRAGITGKLINESINNLSASGFALDAGMQYTTGEKEDFHFGVFIRNLGFPMKFAGDGLIINRPVPLGSAQYDLPFYNRAAKFELPTQFSIGLSKDFYFGNKPSGSDIFCKPMNRFSLSSNFVYNAFTPNNYGLGFEYALRELVSLRLGFLYEQNMWTKESSSRAHMGVSAGISYDMKVGKDKKKTKNPTVLEISYNYRPSWVFGGTHNFGFVYFASKYSYCDEYVIAKAAEVAKAVVPEKREVEKKPEPEIKYITKYDTIFRDAPAKIETVTDYKKVNDMLKNFASNIEFRTATAILTERGEGALMVVGEMLKNYPDTKFLIEGHTDNDGTPENNMRLSKLRAKTVARYLTEFKGIPEVNMKVEWYGETKPVTDNGTNEGKQRNRRVEVKVLDAKLENMSRIATTTTNSSVKKSETKPVPAPAKVETPAPKKDEIKTPTVSTETSSEVPKKDPQDELNENANSITFKAGTDSITRSGKRAILNVANVLKDNKNLNIKIESHTDNGKYASSNMELTEKMAKVVMDLLIQNGIDAGRISKEAFGDTKPKDANDAKNNRRIELKVVK